MVVVISGYNPMINDVFSSYGWRSIVLPSQTVLFRNLFPFLLAYTSLRLAAMLLVCHGEPLGTEHAFRALFLPSAGQVLGQAFVSR